MLETNKIVAQGPRTGLKVKGRKKTVYAVCRGRLALLKRLADVYPLQIPLTWSGSFGNATDPTCSFSQLGFPLLSSLSLS